MPPDGPVGGVGGPVEGERVLADLHLSWSRCTGSKLQGRPGRHVGVEADRDRLVEHLGRRAWWRCAACRRSPSPGRTGDRAARRHRPRRPWRRRAPRTRRQRRGAGAPRACYASAFRHALPIHRLTAAGSGRCRPAAPASPRRTGPPARPRPARWRSTSILRRRSHSCCSSSVTRPRPSCRSARPSDRYPARASSMANRPNR